MDWAQEAKRRVGPLSVQAKICRIQSRLGKMGLGVLLCFAPMVSLQAQGLKYSVTTVGNTYSGKSVWVQQDIEDICVLPDGAVFTNVFWDEAGGNVMEYSQGVPIHVAGHTHGWGYEGGAAIAASGDYVFIAQNVGNEGGGLKGSSWPVRGYTWSGLSRRLRKDVTQPAPFPGGRGKEGDVLPGTFLPVVTVPEGTQGAIRGACADAQHVWVSSPFDDTIKEYDAHTMILLRTWPVPRPDKICLDRQGHLWVLQRPQADVKHDFWRALCYTANGMLLPQRIEFAPAMLPSALCVDKPNHLLIADSGVDQQIKIYADLTTTPRLISTFGVRGGIFAPPAGTFGALRFNQPRGIGTDDDNRIYVASSGSTAGGSTVLECYEPNGRLRWRRMGLTFVDVGDADPKDLLDVYTKEERFRLGAPTQKEKGANGDKATEWSYRGYTVNPYKYPDDPRLHSAGAIAWVRRVQGQKLLFVTDMTAELLHVYRFRPETDGETAIPCALFARRHWRSQDGFPRHQPARGEWMWIDRNGDGKIDAGEYASNDGAESEGILFPDDQGTLWQTYGKTVRAFPLTGLDKNGVPQWDYKRARTYVRPDDMDEARRLRYVPDQDLLLLGGNQGDDHNQHWKPMGPVLCLYSDWSHSKPVLRKRIVLPCDKGASGHESAEPISFDVAGEYVFVAYTRGIAGTGIKNAFVRVLRLRDLSFVGNLVAEGDLGETGLLDLVESVRAVRRSNGEYLVFLEDDYKSKMIVFRWQPAAPHTIMSRDSP